jgi:hypothetical protein
VTRTRRLELSSGVLTADDCGAELPRRDEEKRRWRRKGAAARDEEDPVARSDEEDERDLEAEDGPEFEGFALAAD